MIIATKFRFGSRLCEGKVLSPLTSVVINGNHLVSFANMNVSLRLHDMKITQAYRTLEIQQSLH